MHRSHLLELAVVLSLPAILHCQPATRPQLTDYMLIDLQRLEVTYCLLDSYADSLWPGWHGYRDAGFQFVYPNNVEMLVGYRTPLPGYIEVQDHPLRGMRVWIKRDEETVMAVIPPVVGGGRTMTMGQPVVLIQYPPRVLKLPWMDAWHAELGLSPEESFRLLHTSDEQILTYVHELFHVHESTIPSKGESFGKVRVEGNWPPYAEVEGTALERACLERDSLSARQYVEDFLMAREMKYKNGLSHAQEIETQQETSEGLATYVQFRILDYLRSFKICPTTITADKYFFGFKDAGYFRDFETQVLRRSRAEPTEILSRQYVYGYCQALLLDRFQPDWKRGFLDNMTPFHVLLRNAIRMDSAGAQASLLRLSSVYRLPDIRERHSEKVAETEKVIRSIDERKGKKYIVDFSQIGHLDFIPRGKSYSTEGRLKMYYPEGIEPVEIGGVSLETKRIPIVVQEYYSVECVDDGKAGPIIINDSRKDEMGVCYDALVRTGAFVLKAAKVRITETEKFVKLTLLPVLK